MIRGLGAYRVQPVQPVARITQQLPRPLPPQPKAVSKKTTHSAGDTSVSKRRLDVYV